MKKDKDTLERMFKQKSPVNKDKLRIKNQLLELYQSNFENFEQVTHLNCINEAIKNIDRLTDEHVKKVLKGEAFDQKLVPYYKA